MTAQLNDVVVHAGVDWSLAGVNGEGLFEPASHGLHVRGTSSACWRGFVCRYRLRDEALYLEGLQVGLEGAAPVFLGKRPRRPKGPFALSAEYSGLEHAIPFTGGLLLARDMVPGLGGNMGFHPAWKYTKVLEVELDAGRILGIADRSDAMDDVRRRNAGKERPAPGASQQEISAWVELVFSRRY